MPDDDVQESTPTVLPIWGKLHGHSFNPIIPPLGEPYVTRVHVPFGWGPTIDPAKGVLITSTVRADAPRLGPAGVLRAARDRAWGFRVVDTEGSADA
jgi:hypothetical protein